MANNLFSSRDLVVAKIQTGAARFEEVSARVLRVFTEQEVPGGYIQIRVNGLDTQNPLWGQAFIVKAENCEKSHQ